MMEIFSLEDDDASDLFITQTPSENKNEVVKMGIIDDPMDFTSPCKSLVGDVGQKYSDISDDDDVLIPCSQNIPMARNTNTR